jgi:Tripartite tricarboxylate transporter TctB family
MVGLLALLLAAAYTVDAWQTLSIGRWHKPGAAIFPFAVGLLLAISAISVLLERHGGEDPVPATFSLPAANDLRRLLAVIGAFAIYFLIMPFVGNMIASALFLLAAMWLLSEDPDKSIARLALYAVAMALGFEVFFVRLLKVQMPAGLLRQWLF